MADVGLDMGHVREIFDASTDFTVGLEEEFALVDPDSLELAQRFADVYAACQDDEVLAEAAAGELIEAEIEIRSGRGETFADAVELQRERRERLFALVESKGLVLGATGTHPWADYRDQQIINTDHYNRLREELRWVAQRNSTWSLHVHVGVCGADRAVAVCDHLRGVLPQLLALSANSPFLEGMDTGLHSARTQVFTRTFPRCGVHAPFGDFATYTEFVDLLVRTETIVEATQLWWSVRPHHRFGTVELRICDAQSRGDESFALSGLIVACIAQAAVDHADGCLPAPLGQREVEENLWRAIRHGLDGSMIDFDRGEEVPTPAAIEALVEWTAPVRAELGIEVAFPERNGAQRARTALESGSSLREVYAGALAETRRTYVGEGATRKVAS
ncbi:MAG: glutamate---cysteine ligase / carboxylate-amine ligase [Solirubrobacterales bacterium]|nr:glutamate---cysteine ligase / carboxylate-amine ligase [Solirubrobacterales bacterium]